MISITSADLKDVLSGYDIVPVTLIDLEFSAANPNAGGILRLTDAPRDITIGGNTYNAGFSGQAIGIKGMTPPKTQSTVSRDQYQLRLIDPDGDLRNNRLAVQPSGVPITVRLSFVREDGGSTGLLPDLLNVYRGFLSGTQVTFTDNAPEVAMAFTGQIQQLSVSKPRLTSDEQQQRLFAGDTSLQYAYEDEAANTLRWGRD